MRRLPGSTAQSPITSPSSKQCLEASNTPFSSSIPDAPMTSTLQLTGTSSRSRSSVGRLYTTSYRASSISFSSIVSLAANDR